MKLALVLLMVALASAAGITSAELQEKLAQTATSSFVHLIFVYDSAAESKFLFMFSGSFDGAGHHRDRKEQGRILQNFTNRLQYLRQGRCQKLSLLL